MGFVSIILFIIVLSGYIVFLLDMRAREVDLHLFLHTVGFLIIVYISFLTFILYIMYAYRVEPGNMNLFTIKDISLLLFVLYIIFIMPAYWLINRKVFPKFQKKYGLKSIQELRGMSFCNKKKMIKKWENENADLEDYKP